MNLDELSKQVFPALVASIRSSSVLASQDIKFYKSLDKNVAARADESSSRLLDISSSLLASVSNEVGELSSMEDFESKWKSISNVLDILYEKTDIALDDLSRDKKPADEIQSREMSSLGQDDDGDIRKHKVLAKPQLLFKRAVNNSKHTPFKPLLREKPNALVPWDPVPVQEPNEEGVLETFYLHPYQTEIKHQLFPDKTCHEPVPFTDWNSTSAILVDTAQTLQDMIHVLNTSDVIAVDLEHHDFRSYNGFVCLMQISNRSTDWIIDTLVLRDELLALNQIFTNPNIVKVFHGSYMDMIWLQRDFGLYVVSLFDTYCAAKALNLKKLGLAYLLETYAHFQTSKKYQLADWRIRPLPKEMLRYARADTHFLCYIYDELRNQLVENDLLDIVLEDSKKMALQKYEKSGYLKAAAPGWRNILITYRLSPTQEVVLQDLYEWRDKVARDLDESPRYVMPNHFMVSLCTQMPTTVQGVLSAATGATPHVRTDAKEIAAIIAGSKRTIESLNFEHESGHLQESELGDLDYSETANYDQYMSSYKKAVNKQKHLFAPKAIGVATKLLYKQVSHFYGESESDEEEIITDSEYQERRVRILENLDLGYGFDIEIEGEDDLENGMEDHLEDHLEEGMEEHFGNEKHSQQHSENDVQIPLDGSQSHDDEPEDLDLLPAAHDDDALFINSKQRRKAKRKQMMVVKRDDKKRKKELTKQLERFSVDNDEAVAPAPPPPSVPNDDSNKTPSSEPLPFDYTAAEAVLQPDPKKIYPSRKKTFTSNLNETVARPRKGDAKKKALKGQRTGTFRTKK